MLNCYMLILGDFTSGIEDLMCGLNVLTYEGSGCALPMSCRGLDLSLLLIALRKGKEL